MIFYIFNNRGARHVYYDYKYRGVTELNELDICVVSRQTLTQRLSMAIKRPDRTDWKTVHQCMVTPSIKGRPMKTGQKKKEKKKEIRVFRELMMAMPTNKYKPLIINCKPLGKKDDRQITVKRGGIRQVSGRCGYGCGPSIYSDTVRAAMSNLRREG